MRRRTIVTITVSALAALAAPALVVAGPAPPAPASPSDDDAPPELVLDPYARPEVGSQITTYYDGGSLEYWEMDARLTWTADDPSGICEQTVAWSGYESIEQEVDPVLAAPATVYPVDPEERTFLATNLNLLNWLRIRDQFVVRATDCAGNTAVSDVADTVFPITEDRSPEVTYRGRWQVARASWFSGRTVHVAKRRGASATVDFDGDGPVALVMSQGPSRGRADVYVDDVRVATVDTHRATARNRVVVWEGRFDPGPHVLRVVNRATPGHPRITLDAFLLRDAPA